MIQLKPLLICDSSLQRSKKVKAFHGYVYA